MNDWPLTHVSSHQKSCHYIGLYEDNSTTWLAFYVQGFSGKEVNMMMRHSAEDTVTLSLIIGLLGLLSGVVRTISEIEITGIISKDGRLCGDDGVFYEIAENNKGIELLELDGRKVDVGGYVGVSDGATIITVTEFEIVQKGD
jgi:hypothetical protein